MRIKMRDFLEIFQHGAASLTPQSRQRFRFKNNICFLGFSCLAFRPPSITFYELILLCQLLLPDMYQLARKKSLYGNKRMHRVRLSKNLIYNALMKEFKVRDCIQVFAAFLKPKKLSSITLNIARTLNSPLVLCQNP